MAKILLHPGIGERFSYQKRKWVIHDLKDREYTCKTVDNDKKPALVRTFDMETLIKICR